MEAAVSIIIPCYNVEKFIDRCIESIVNQTMRNMEIILINDGSTDSTLEKCNEWKKIDARVKIFSQSNKGLARTRNRGIDLSTSKYIIFVDSDDYVEINMVESLYECIKNKKCNFVFSGIRHIFSDDKEILQTDRFIFKGLANTDELPELIYKCDFSSVAKIFDKSFLLENEIFFPENLYYEDQFFTLRAILYSKNIAHLPEVFYNYDRQHDNSITKEIKYLNDVLDIYALIYDYFKEKNFYHTYKKELKIITQIVFNNYCYLIKKNDKKYDYIIRKFMNFFYTNFGLDDRIEELRIGVYGGYSSKAILQKLFLDRDNIIFHIMRNSICSFDNFFGKEKITNIISGGGAFLRECIEKDLSGTIEDEIINSKNNMDYLLIDFLEGRFDIYESNLGLVTASDAFAICNIRGLEINKKIEFASEEFLNLFEEKIADFMKFIEKEYSHEKIILHELYLTKRYGNSRKKNDFADKEKISYINDILKVLYENFKYNYPMVRVIKLDGRLNYCDNDFIYGKEPYHLNDYAYMTLAEQVYEICINDKCLS